MRISHFLVCAGLLFFSCFGAQALEITTTTLPNGRELEPYSFQLSFDNVATNTRWGVGDAYVTYSNDLETAEMGGLYDIKKIAALREYEPAAFVDGRGMAYPSLDHQTYPRSWYVTDAAGTEEQTWGARFDGSVFTGWGRGDFGAVPPYEVLPSMYPLPDHLGGVTAVAAGDDNALAITAYGSAVGLANGLLVYHPYSLSRLPVDGAFRDITGGQSELIDVACGAHHRLVLTSKGRIVPWLLNLRYDVGQTVIPEDLTNVTAIAAGSYHSLALLDDGTVFAFGTNDAGQCSVPKDLTNVVAISAAGDSSVALLADGTTVAWGEDVGAHGLENVAMIEVGDGFCTVLSDEGHRLPMGISLQSNGLFYGTPYMAGTFDIMVQLVAKDGDETVKTSAVFPLTIEPGTNQAPVIASALPEGDRIHLNETEQCTFSVSVSDPEGSALSYRWSLDNVDVATNVTSYTVETDWGFVGPHTLHCYITDGVWPDATIYKEWPLYVHNIPMDILNTALVTGVEKEAYSEPLSATNGLAPYSWEATPPVRTWGVLGDANFPDTEDLQDVVQVDAGWGFYLALKKDGTVRQWGRDLALYEDITPPEGLTNIVHIAADCWQGLAVHADGGVTRWGGYGSYPYGQGSQQLSVTNAVAAAGGGSGFSLVLCDDGRVIEFDDGTNGDTILDGAVAVAAGRQHRLVLLEDGTVVEWNNNYSDGSETEGLSGVVAIAAGESYSLALKADGTVVAWGKYTSGTMHGGVPRQMFVPEGLKDVVAISAGFSFCTALKADGTVVTWGNEEMYPNGYHVPADLGKVKQISAGYGCFALMDDSERLPEGLILSEDGLLSGIPAAATTNTIGIICRDAAGERRDTTFVLEIGDNPNRPPELELVPARTEITVERGGTLDFAVTATDPEGAALSYRWFLDGVELAETGASYTFNAPLSRMGRFDLRCIISDGFWTEEVSAEWIVLVTLDALAITNETLPLGMQRMPYQAQLHATNGIAPYSFYGGTELRCWGRYSSSNFPIVDVAKIYAGNKHFAAMDKDGRLYEWGYLYESQPEDFGAFIDADCGWYYFTVAVTDDGDVQAWGNNRYGSCDVPVNLGTVVDVDAGFAHVLALQDDGTVVSWGNDLDTVPAELSNVVAVAAGRQHSLALIDDGTVMAWGSDSNLIECAVPSGLSNVAAIAAGEYFSLALLDDGSVEAWGDNSVGQCAVPEGLTNVVSISCGGNICYALQENGQLVGWGNSGYVAIPEDLGMVLTMVAGYESCLVLHAPEIALPEGLTLSRDGLISGVPVESSCQSIKFTVQDKGGRLAYKTLNLLMALNPNQLPPVISTMSPQGPLVNMGEAVSQDFSVDAYDPEGRNLVYRWTWDGVNVGADLHEYTRNTTWGDAGIYVLSCDVSDGHFSSNALWSVTILDDNDSDGVSNASERRAGTNPMDPDSFFGIRGMQDRSLSFYSVPGRSYQVYSSDDLVSWVPSGAPIVATGDVVDWTPPAADVPCRFYRIVVAEASAIP